MLYTVLPAGPKQYNTTVRYLRVCVGGGVKGPRNQCAEMEFLNINLTKDSSLLLHAMHSACYWAEFKKTLLFSG